MATLKRGLREKQGDHSLRPDSSLDRIEQVKRLTVIGLFSDDILAELLVLKGGNALSLVYELGHRGSLDLDFSIEGDFPPEIHDALAGRIEAALNKVFEPEGIVAFDVRIEEVPSNVTPDMAPFWGGYEISFKLIGITEYLGAKGDMDQLRRRAIITGPQQAKKVQVEISKYEFCGEKGFTKLDGFKIRVYSPSMIVCEKLRAICQQAESYCQLVRRSPRPRARDFYDIYATMQKYTIDPGGTATRELLRDIFHAKRVPLNLLDEMKEVRAFHEQDFDAVRDTVPTGTDLKPFGFYFEFVLGLCKALKPLGK
jgi:predicted nucleotidyltransferase component of viral defense system